MAVLSNFRRLCTYVAAFLAAAIVATALALLFALGVQKIAFALLPFSIALAHALILGLPAFLLFRAKRWVGLLPVIGASFLIGAIPIGLLSWPLQPGSNFETSTGGVPTIVNGVPTLAGWLEYFQLLGLFGLFGACGGIAFWSVLKASGELAVSDIPKTSFQRKTGMALTSIIGLATLGVLAIPTITKDRTCHNMFRDGRTSIGPQVNIELQISKDDWPRLTALARDFATTHGMSFRDKSETHPGVVSVLYLDLCTDSGVNIEAHDQRWASRNYGPLLGNGTPIGVYELNSGSGWQRFAKDFVGELAAIWPEAVKFRDGGGHIVSAPPELQ